MEAIFIGQMIQWAGNWVPQGWALCDGRQLLISAYPQLYAVIGSTYGGDNQTHFNLPDLNGTVPIGAGQGPGLQNYDIGVSGGQARHTLNINELPDHTHVASLQGTKINLQLKVSTHPATDSTPSSSLVPAAGASPGTTGGDSVDVYLYNQSVPDSQMTGLVCTVSVSNTGITLSDTGDGAAHENMMPYLPMYYIISLTEGMLP